MRQLTLSEQRQVEWIEVPEPGIEGEGQAIVRPLAVALCDLDLPIIRGQAPIPPPVALGHECVAEVLEIGDEVRASARAIAWWCRSRSPAASALVVAAA